MSRARAGWVGGQGEEPGATRIPLGDAANHAAAAGRALRGERADHRTFAATARESWYRLDHDALARAASNHAATLRAVAHRREVLLTDCDALKAGEDALERRAAQHWLTATGSLDPRQQNEQFSWAAEAEAHALGVRALRLAVEGVGGGQ